MTTISAMIIDTIRENYHTSVNNTYIEDDIDTFIRGHSDGDMMTVLLKVNEGLDEGVVVKLGFLYFVVSYRNAYVKCCWVNNQFYLLRRYINIKAIEEEENEEENELSEVDTDEEGVYL